MLDDEVLGLFTLLKGNNRVIALSKYSIPSKGRICVTPNSVTLLKGLKPQTWNQMEKVTVDEIALAADRLQLRHDDNRSGISSTSVSTKHANGGKCTIETTFNQNNAVKQLQELTKEMAKQSNKEADTLF